MCSFLWMVVHHVRWKICIASTLQCTERPRDEVAQAPPCILERQDWSCAWTAWAEPSPSTLALKLHIYITSPAPRRVKHCCSWPQLRSLPVRKRKRESMSLLSSPAHLFRKKMWMSRLQSLVSGACSLHTEALPWRGKFAAELATKSSHWPIVHRSVSDLPALGSPIPDTPKSGSAAG